MLPIGGLLTCLFLGWWVPRQLVSDEITNWGTLWQSHRGLSMSVFSCYLFLIRYLCPTAIAAIMELVNAIYIFKEKMQDSEGDRKVFSSAMATVLTTLSPITPHICEELWERMGHREPLAGEPWPVFDEAAMVRDTQTIAVQVNGKLRGTMEMPTGADRQAMEEAALAFEPVKRFTKDLTVRKVIVVPGKLVNVVAK
ncbi:MAG: class I tRNA ligase family protein [Desulfovibrio sp.]|nr:class I tRNA ligase family protein [Desulfovibrio sp.]